MTSVIAAPQSPDTPPVSDPAAGGTQSRLRILVIVQATLAAVSAIEASVFGLSGAAPPFPYLLTAAGAAITSLLAWRLRAPSIRVLTLTRRLQIGWLVFATVDLLLSIFLARRGLSIAAFATRFVMPVWIYRLARQEANDALA
ncbi:MAG: hypothetical protein OEM97_04440 [Acidimicrobiia bacterium]|nr:hypothetical protein [Acidimicrobiia bacterium]